MGPLTIIATTVIGVLLAALASQMASEFRDWTPRWTEWLIDRAVRRLPADLQERMAEEWREFVSDAPGHIAKLKRALGLPWAALAYDLNLSDKWPRIFSRLVGCSALVLFWPLLLLVFGVVAFRGGTMLDKSETSNVYRFRIGDDKLSEILEKSSFVALPGLWNLANGELIVHWLDVRRFVVKFLKEIFTETR
jgi:hypothetical protein